MMLALVAAIVVVIFLLICFPLYFLIICLMVVYHLDPPSLDLFLCLRLLVCNRSGCFLLAVSSCCYTMQFVRCFRTAPSCIGLTTTVLHREIVLGLHDTLFLRFQKSYSLLVLLFLLLVLHFCHFFWMSFGVFYVCTLENPEPILLVCPVV